MSRRPNFGGMGMGGMNMQQMMKQEVASTNGRRAGKHYCSRIYW